MIKLSTEVIKRLKSKIMIIIKKDGESYVVRHILTEYSNMVYNSLDWALNLCRVRLNKCRAGEYDKEPLSIIKVPFINNWVVW